MRIGHDGNRSRTRLRDHSAPRLLSTSGEHTAPLSLFVALSPSLFALLSLLLLLCSQLLLLLLYTQGGGEREIQGKVRRRPPRTYYAYIIQYCTAYMTLSILFNRFRSNPQSLSATIVMRARSVRRAWV